MQDHDLGQGQDNDGEDNGDDNYVIMTITYLATMTIMLEEDL